MQLVDFHTILYCPRMFVKYWQEMSKIVESQHFRLSSLSTLHFATCLAKPFLVREQQWLECCNCTKYKLIAHWNILNAIVIYCSLQLATLPAFRTAVSGHAACRETTVIIASHNDRLIFLYVWLLDIIIETYQKLALCSHWWQQLKTAAVVELVKSVNAKREKIYYLNINVFMF